jgi:hypothetical protein
MPISAKSPCNMGPLGPLLGTITFLRVAKGMPMRGLLLMTVLVLTGCASGPKAPAAPPVIVADAVPASKPLTEEQRIAYAKTMHFKLVTQKGQELFCQNDPVTGSHMYTAPRCYTGQELDELQREYDIRNRNMFRAVTPSPAQGQSGH